MIGKRGLFRAAVVQLETLPGVQQLDEAFAQEHALEVQLPFLQAMLDDFTLVPLIVGDADSDDVAQVIEAGPNGYEVVAAGAVECAS